MPHSAELLSTPPAADVFSCTSPPNPKVLLRRSGTALAIPLSLASGRFVFSDVGTSPTPNPKITCFFHRLRRGQPCHRRLRGASRQTAIIEEGGRRGEEKDNVLHKS
jgi:hypothetical protein